MSRVPVPKIPIDFYSGEDYYYLVLKEVSESGPKTKNDRPLRSKSA